MPRFFRKLAILAKREVSYGTDPTPTGADNAMLAIDASLSMLEATEEERGLYTPYLGHQGVILTGCYARLEFGIEVAGAGAAGDVPAWGALLRACGFSETVTENTDVEYAPVSAAFDAVTLYYNRDGVRAILLGARGNVTVEFTPSRIPRFRFTFTGLDGTMADTALPSLTLDAFQVPVPVSDANTSFSLHGHAGATESLSIDCGNQVEPRMLINHESIQLVDRKVTGTAVLEAVLLASKNWKAIAKAHTTGALSLVHGTVAGNIVEFAAPAVQIGRPSEGQTQGILNNSLPLIFQPDSGNDELTIVVK